MREDTQFSQGNQPAKRGRPKGSRNRASLLDQDLKTDALEQLKKAVNNGESWAVLAVTNRIYPTLKPVTIPTSLDGRYLEAKITELTDVQERLRALEDRLGAMV